MSSREKSIQQLMINLQRKKCPKTGCWIGTTERQFCPVCDETLMPAEGGPFADTRRKTVMRIDSRGKILEDNRDKFPNKLEF